MTGIAKVFLVFVLAMTLSVTGGGMLQGGANYDKPGFVTAVDEDGRLWIFRVGSEEPEILEEGNFPDKHFTLPGKGPGGMTIKTLDRETAMAYLGVEE